MQSNCQNSEQHSSLIPKVFAKEHIIKPSFIQPLHTELTILFNNTDSDPFILPNDSKLSCILYADDLIILSRSRFGLQKCLNELQNWCSKWLMEVNLKKTKIMIFQKGNKKMTKPSFTPSSVPGPHGWHCAVSAMRPWDRGWFHTRQQNRRNCTRMLPTLYPGSFHYALARRLSFINDNIKQN